MDYKCTYPDCKCKKYTLSEEIHCEVDDKRKFVYVLELQAQLSQSQGRVKELERIEKGLSDLLRDKEQEITKLNTYIDSLEVSAGLRHKEAAYQDFHRMGQIPPLRRMSFPPTILKPTEEENQTLRNQVARLLLTIKNIAQSGEKGEGRDQMSAALWRAIATWDE